MTTELGVTESLPHIGIVLSSMSRQSGGILGATSPLLQELQRQGKRSTVFSVIDEDSSRDLVNWETLSVRLFKRVGARAFGYCPSMSRALMQSNLDLVHTHGLWLYTSVAVMKWSRISGKPYIVSPHGMLDQWALRNSRFKKKVASILFENRHLKNASCIHALNVEEYDAVRRYGLTNPVAIIPNGVTLPSLKVTSSKAPWSDVVDPSSKVLLFLGRIHPKKGLEALISAWAKATPVLLQDWHLIIAGWDDGGHLETLKLLVSTLNVSDSVSFVGALYGEEKRNAFQLASGFILPSSSEGLPIAVLEAWSYQVPVLMTKHCNLPEGFAEGAAIEIGTSSNEIVEGLISLSNHSGSDLHSIGILGRKLVAAKFSWTSISQQINSVYTWVSHGTDMPECVRLE